MKKNLLHKKLNLGCGSRPLDGYVNIDIEKAPYVDMVHDLNKFPYPFNDNTFEEVYCSHVLEHLSDFRKVMRELWRITKPGGVIKIFSPYFSGFIYWGEAEHKLHFSYRTFNYWAKPPAKMFNIKRREIIFSINSKFLNSVFSPFINHFPNFYERFLCWTLPSEVIEYELEVVK